MFGPSKKEKDILLKDFLDKHLSDKLLIIADPKDDSLYMKYGKVYVLTKIKSMDGKDYKVVKNVLKHSRFKTNIDRLLGGLAEAMQLSIRDGNEFWKWIDAALFNISKRLTINKQHDYAKEEENSGSSGTGDPGDTANGGGNSTLSRARTNEA